MKICEKHNCEFKTLTWTTGGKIRTQSLCPLCRKEYKSDYYKNNRAEILEEKSGYYQNNKSVLDEKHNNYVLDNKTKITEYKANWFQDNKKNISLNRRKRYSDDISFRLRDIFSKSIRQKLKIVGSSKTDSYLKFVDYSIDELRSHLEKQFEPWMDWNNYGKYNARTWKDDDQSTWTWNIDHIIPQSELLYQSMTDDNFKKCWALSNLRPLSSKQNLLDGLTKVRHNK
jgi:hypothetical protein